MYLTAGSVVNTRLSFNSYIDWSNVGTVYYHNTTKVLQPGIKPVTF